MLWRTLTNRASQPCCMASGGADEARSSGLIGQCNSAMMGTLDELGRRGRGKSVKRVDQQMC